MKMKNILKLAKSVAKSIAIVALLILALILVLFVAVQVYCGACRLYYSDERLYSFAKNYIVQDVGLELFNREVNDVLSTGFTNELYRSEGYWPPTGSCLGKMAREFPSMPYYWDLNAFEGQRAMVMRFGDHSNYAWLVAVDPSERIRFDGDKVRRIADNIAVVHDFSKIYPSDEAFDELQPEHPDKAQ